MHLFLDIDGILNNQSQVSDEIQQNNLSWITFENGVTSIPQTAMQVDFDRESLKNINMYLHIYEPKIVISSAWRMYLLLEELIKMLYDKGLDISVDNVIGSTIVGEYDRSYEITQWMSDNVLIEPIIIFEDMHKDIIDNFADKYYVFVCQGWYQKGFTQDHLQEAICKTEKQLQGF